MTDYVIVECYRTALGGTTAVTRAANADGIELAPMNGGAPANRGGGIPSAGLTRSG